MKAKIQTSTKRHPEDLIFETKTFINELTNVQETYFDRLCEQLDLKEEGINWLFDYIHNSGEEGQHISFDEYLSFFNKSYKDFTNT